MNVDTKTQADPSVGELVSQLSSQTSRLVRDEMKLAQNEFREAAKHAGLGAGLLSVAGLISKNQVKQTSPVPQQTVASVKLDIDEVKEARHDRR
jgi:Putative Actinobacterial Holin-X, holin superfamily III